MRKVLVGMVAMVSAVGVSACGSSDKTREKAPVAQTSGALAQKPSDLNPAGASDLSVVRGPQSGALEAVKTPRFTVVLGEGKGGFKFRSVTLSDDAKAKIDEIFAGDEIDPKSAHFELEGHTDNLGPAELNHQVGLARAQAVKQYLSERFEIPGDCISVVSYGMDKPVADNSTPEGRARNRRVVIRVVD